MIESEIKYISQQEYHDFERFASDKHEYFQGEIFVINGASILHNIVSMNCLFNVSSKLKGKIYQTFGSKFRIHIPENTFYAYPDLSIFSDEIFTTDKNDDTATNPIVILEVRCKHFRTFNKENRFTLYRQIESLKEYVLVDYDKIYAEKYTRKNDNSWQLTEFKDLNQTIELNSIEIDLKLSEIYDRTKFNKS
jgi:Uma2 family endonuclease